MRPRSTVFRRERQALEDGAGLQRGGVAHGVGREIDHADLGQLGLDALALHGIVVDEGQRIDPDVELAGDLAQALRLVVPVDADGAEVFGAQEHAGMLFDGLQRVGRVVFAGDCQNDTRAWQDWLNHLLQASDAPRRDTRRRA